MAEGRPPLVGVRRPAWVEQDLRGATGHGIRIAMVDSGHDPAWHDRRVRPGIGLIGDGEGFDLVRSPDVRDRHGHGTACTDIVLRLAPNVEVVPVRVFGATLETSTEVIVAALEWAIEQGVSIINLSLGTLLHRALRPFYCLCEQARSQGIAVVSAVHLGEGWSYPAVFENTLGVTAGHFAGPFEYIFRADQGAECQAQGDCRVRWLGGARRRLFGSSFAAPHISAVVALLLERFPDSDLEQIRALLARFAVSP